MLSMDVKLQVSEGDSAQLQDFRRALSSSKFKASFESSSGSYSQSSKSHSKSGQYTSDADFSGSPAANPDICCNLLIQRAATMLPPKCPARWSEVDLSNLKIGSKMADWGT